MSTVKAVNFQHPSSTAANLTLAADGTVSGGLPAGGRNLLYNGAMQVAQRGTSTASITSGNTYGSVDRWFSSMSSLGTWTQSQETDAPTGSGFRKSMKMLVTTADASPAAGDYCLVAQSLEGQDLQRILKGTSAAQQLTLSFWVKASTTGTYVAELDDADNTRRVSASYTISASATWEKKTITFPADTTGAFDNDNAASLTVGFWLGAGSTYTGGSPLQTAWGTATNTRATGQVNLAAANNNYWQVTGVQLEVGPVASAFEFKPYGQELRECQRYFFSTEAAAYGPLCIAATQSTTAGRAFFPLPVAMRTAPTGITIVGSAPSVGTGAYTSLTFDRATNTALMLALAGTGFTAGGANMIYGNLDITTRLQVTGAEL